MALTVEELRALLALVLGSSNLALLFVNRALAAEQQAADKAQLNLAVLQKQVRARGGGRGRCSGSSSGRWRCRGSTRSSWRGCVRAVSHATACFPLAAPSAPILLHAHSFRCTALQAKGLQTEYLRATSAPDGGGGGGAAGRDAGGKSEVSKLIADKHRLQEQLEGAQQELRSAQTNAAAVKAQSQVRCGMVAAAACALLRPPSLRAYWRPAACLHLRMHHCRAWSASTTGCWPRTTRLRSGCRARGMRSTRSLTRRRRDARALHG